MPIHNVRPYRYDQVILDINAASTTYVHGLVAYDQLAHVDTESPDKARNATVSLKNNSGGNLSLPDNGGGIACTCVVAGITKFGEAVTETFTFNAGGPYADQTVLTATGVQIFTKITQFQFTGAIPVGWELCAGIGNKAGLNRKIGSAASVIAVKRNNDDDPVANYVIDPVYFGITPNVAWIAGEDITVDFAEE